jgi:hypothetical protein
VFSLSGTNLQRLPVLPRRSQHLLHILRKPQLPQRFVDMLGGNRLLSFFLGDFVCFRGDEGDELDAAVDEEVARIFAES